MVDSATRDRYVRIANMKLHEVPQAQIAIACNLTEGRISQILEEDEFKQIYAQCLTEFHEKYDTLNKGWDALEETAIGNLIDIMRYNKDADFQLRVAMVANKANRRGSHPNNRPIDASLGARAVIVLNQNFVDRLQGTVREATPILNGTPTATPIPATNQTNQIEQNNQNEQVEQVESVIDPNLKKQTNLMPPAQVANLIEQRKTKQKVEEIIDSIDGFERLMVK